MSSIWNVNGLESSDLTYLMQKLSNRSQAAQSDDSSVDGSIDQVAGPGANDRGIESMKKEIDAAISEALKKLDKSASADEIMQTIKSAVDSTLKANGINPEAMKSGMQPPTAPSGSGANSAAMPPRGSPGGPGGPDEFMSKIEELLQENGFDVEKFKSELVSKMAKQSGSSTLDLLKNLGSSQGVNEQA